MKNLSQRFSDTKLFLFVIVLASIYVSCQKDDLISPATSSLSTPTLKVSATHLNNSPETEIPRFVIFKVSHQSGNSQELPSYNVSLYNDGLVLFEGLRNVKVEGIHDYRISPSILEIVKADLAGSSFYSINDNLGIVPDLACCVTTLQLAADQESKTLVDYNNGFPVELISIREKVEGILNDNIFIKGNTRGLSSVLENE